MPLYDCGAEGCGPCQRAFGPDRSKAIRARRKAQEYWDLMDCYRTSRRAWIKARHAAENIDTWKTAGELMDAAMNARSALYSHVKANAIDARAEAV